MSTLRAELVALRSTLATATSAKVYIRDDLPFNAATGAYEPPTASKHIILDLIPGAPTTELTGGIYEDLIVQVSAWSDVSLTDAIDLAEDARASIEPAWARTGGVQFGPRDGEWRGVIFTATKVASFGAFTT
jgi:hypothetical protein